MPGWGDSCRTEDYIKPPIYVVWDAIINGLADPAVYRHWARNHFEFAFTIGWVADGEPPIRHQLQKGEWKEE